MTSVVCVLHGHPPIPRWLSEVGRFAALYVTVNDPDAGESESPPLEAIMTRNPVPRGFAENVNTALLKAFQDEACDIACVVNFDLDMQYEAIFELESGLEADPALGALAAVLVAPDGSPTFSVGTLPTPLKEFLRASGLRSGPLFRLQRLVLRHWPGWAARNAAPTSHSRSLGAEEYIPWSCIAVRRQAWEQTGPLDERFPLYGEDIDWSLRCHQAGWRLGLHDCGRVVHSERATRGERADTLYEYSHLALHRKWGWSATLRWQEYGLRLRRCWFVKRLAPPLDWSLLTVLDRGRYSTASPDCMTEVIRDGDSRLRGSEEDGR